MVQELNQSSKFQDQAHGVDHAHNTLVGVRREMDPGPVHGRLLTKEHDALHCDAPPIHLLTNQIKTAVDSLGMHLEVSIHVVVQNSQWRT